MEMVNNNVEIIISNNADEIKEFFQSLLKKLQKATINSENNDDKCFRYTVTVVSHHKKL